MEIMSILRRFLVVLAGFMAVVAVTALDLSFEETNPDWSSGLAVTGALFFVGAVIILAGIIVTRHPTFDDLPSGLPEVSITWMAIIQWLAVGLAGGGIFMNQFFPARWLLTVAAAAAWVAGFTFSFWLVKFGKRKLAEG